MSRREILPLLLGLALLGASAHLAHAQAKYGVEEYNAYVDTTRAQDPSQKISAIETFLQNYPNSILRAFVYPDYFQAAWQVNEYDKVMTAVDDFLGMDKTEVEDLYKQSKFNDQQIQYTYYRGYLSYAYSFLQTANGQSEADIERAARNARRGLELHSALYNGFQPPAEQREQFEQTKRQEESAFHTVLAYNAWRNKDYNAAAREYGILVKNAPTDPAIHYRLGLANLQKEPSAYRTGFWYLARSVALGIPKSGEIKDFLTTRVAAYEQAVPECIQAEVDGLVAHAKDSAAPPPDWMLLSGDRVNGVRNNMSLQRILDDLQAGGETAKLMYLASCGSEIGVGEDGQPDLYVKVLAVTEETDNLVTLRVAAGQEAAVSGIANMEVIVAAPAEATKLKEEDVVRVSGTISSYLSDPQFLLQLAQGRVNAEDIPKSR
jgi:hypothetical protein